MAEQTDRTVFKRSDEFVSLYANNIQFEVSSFDLRIIFGQLDRDRESGRITVEQHTSMTVSWVQAKLILYYLQTNIAGFEHFHGEKIKIPDDVLPPPVPEPTDDIPKVRQMHEIFKKIREEFIAANR